MFNVCSLNATTPRLQGQGQGTEQLFGVDVTPGGKNLQPPPTRQGWLLRNKPGSTLPGRMPIISDLLKPSPGRFSWKEKSWIHQFCSKSSLVRVEVYQFVKVWFREKKFFFHYSSVWIFKVWNTSKAVKNKADCFTYLSSQCSFRII